MKHIIRRYDWNMQDIERDGVNGDMSMDIRIIEVPIGFPLSVEFRAPFNALPPGATPSPSDSDPSLT